MFLKQANRNLLKLLFIILCGSGKQFNSTIEYWSMVLLIMSVVSPYEKREVQNPEFLDLNSVNKNLPSKIGTCVDIERKIVSIAIVLRGGDSPSSPLSHG